MYRSNVQWLGRFPRFCIRIAVKEKKKMALQYSRYILYYEQTGSTTFFKITILLFDQDFRILLPSAQTVGNHSNRSDYFFIG